MGGENGAIGDPSEDLLAVRKRPGMYFGGTDRAGQTRLLWEVLANAVDLVLAGTAGTVRVDLHGNHGLVVEDDGPGLRGSTPQQLRRWLSCLHDTPTRDDHEPHVHLTPGLQGVGLAAVAAVCARFSIRSTGPQHQLVAELREGRLHTLDQQSRPAGQPTGTRVELVADEQIFPHGWDRDAIPWRLFELACLCPGLTLLHHEHTLRGGIPDLLPGGRAAAPFHEREGRTPDGLRLRMALRRTPHSGLESTLLTYVNLSPLPGRGSLHEALSRGLQPSHREPPLGACVVAALWHPAPRYAGPCRDELDVPELVEPVTALVRTLLADLR